MRRIPVTYTIPQQLVVALHTKIGVGQMSKFVTQALWEALRKEEEALLMEFLQADEDSGNLQIKDDFAPMSGDDFIGLDDFETNFSKSAKKPKKRKRKIHET